MSAQYALYLESGPRKKTTMAHVPELLGCVANGPTTEAALEITPDEIRAFLRFLQRHGEDVDPDERFETTIVAHVMEGSWIGYGDPAPGFPPDFEPLTRTDLAMHLERLRWIGEELVDVARGLTPSQLAAEPERGHALQEILRHIAAAEPEYVRTAGAGKPEGAKELLKTIEESPEQVINVLASLWGIIIAQFESIPAESMNNVTQRGEKPYTARRGLRRALEHPWEHLREIERQLQARKPSSAQGATND